MWTNEELLGQAIQTLFGGFAQYVLKRVNPLLATAFLASQDPAQMLMARYNVMEQILEAGEDLVTQVMDKTTDQYRREARLTSDKVASTIQRQLPGISDVRSIRRIPFEETQELEAHLNRNTPLRRAIDRLPVDLRDKTEKILTNGMMAGIHPDLIKKQLQDEIGMEAHRAETLARTSILNAHRSAAARSFQDNRDVVKSWIWDAATELKNSPCPVCWAMHGTEHPIEEEMITHPRCRCSPIPKTYTWEELGFTPGTSEFETRIPDYPTGEELFARLSEDKQRRILGDARLALYRMGDYNLRDFVGRKHVEGYGDVRVLRSLRSLGYNRRGRTSEQEQVARATIPDGPIPSGPVPSLEDLDRKLEDGKRKFERGEIGKHRWYRIQKEVKEAKALIDKTPDRIATVPTPTPTPPRPVPTPTPTPTPTRTIGTPKTVDEVDRRIMELEERFRRGEIAENTFKTQTHKMRKLRKELVGEETKLPPPPKPAPAQRVPDTGVVPTPVQEQLLQRTAVDEPDFVTRVKALRQDPRNPKLDDVEKAGKIILEEVDRRMAIQYPKSTLTQDDVNALYVRYSDKSREVYQARNGPPEVLARLSREMDALHQEYVAAFNASRGPTIFQHTQVVYDVLGEIRSFGGDFSFIMDRSISNRLQGELKRIETLFPTDWINGQIGKDPTGRPTIVGMGDGRGSYNHDRGLMGISKWDAHGLYAHETFHRMEATIPGILDLENQYYLKRTAGYREEHMGPGYRANEYTIADKFLHRYSGKRYVHPLTNSPIAFEIGTMGMEMISRGGAIEKGSGNMAQTLWSKDPDMARFMVGMLAVL